MPSPAYISGEEGSILHHQFKLLTGFSPMSWQTRLFSKHLKIGEPPSAVDIPTGLGKTAIMALWLIALATGAKLPRRLVYVVDRRAVVDQATEFAELLRAKLDSPEAAELKKALRLGDRSLPISTLRGQHVDNREWLEDPASPAIIVGTVDMIGSRLLFEGYGVSRKMRPYHAGLLGTDTLVVLDEAHLVPPFEKLLESIEGEADRFAARDETDRKLIPPFRLLSLSATGRERVGTVFRLEGSCNQPRGQRCDLDDRVVQQRLTAKKGVTIIPADSESLETTLAAKAWTLADGGDAPIRCIVYCDKRETAEAVKRAIEVRAKGDKQEGRLAVDIHPPEIFVGARRVFEREGVAARLKELGFIAGSAVSLTKPAFLIATSAGEVGVDLDADHMVCDLVAWQRMVQRLGRVNRRGKGDAKVAVVLEPEQKPKKAVADALAKAEADRNEKDHKAIAAFQANREKSLAQSIAFRRPFDDALPRREDGKIDASPGALRDVKVRTANESEEEANLRRLLDAATTPPPLRPALTRPLVDAWSMTSLEEHTGRPEIGPWLRGWVDEKPQTTVLWRKYLPVRTGDARPSKKEIESFFEAAPPHASELLETETYRVVEWLIKRATMLRSRQSEYADTRGAADTGAENASDTGHPVREPMAPIGRGNPLGFVLSGAGDLRRTLRWSDITDADNKKAKEKKEALENVLSGTTLVIDARVGGLRDGLLRDDVGDIPPTADGDDWSNVRFRVRSRSAGESPTTDPNWRERLRFDVERTEDGESRRWLVVEKWRHDAATEEDRSAGRPQVLDEHQSWAAQRALGLAQRLGLEGVYAKALVCATRLHDEGKKAERWQLAFNAPRGGKPYAKTAGPLNRALLGGYRHEFGSLPFATDDPEFRVLPNDMQGLVLHLIAAHHGYARPIISTENCEDAPPSVLKGRAREVALRFARLQKRWGPWGLAWWEALLRAADQQASRDNDAGIDGSRGESA